jgi:hypothetical protein
VLTVVAGAVGRHLHAVGVDPGGLDFRMTMPANVRAAGEHGETGNRVGVLTIPLPRAAGADPDNSLATRNPTGPARPGPVPRSARRR